MASLAAIGRSLLSRRVDVLAFVAAYVALDWFSYIEPLFGLDITPWNPGPALGLVYWMKNGKSVVLPWLVALLVGEAAVRDLPAGPILSVVLSAWLVTGYGVIGEWLRRHFTIEAIFDNRTRLMIWINIVVFGTLANSLVFISLNYVFGLIPHGQWLNAFTRFWIGDLVGILVTMPMLWLLASSPGRVALRTVLRQRETAGYLILAAGVLWFVFWFRPSYDFKHFYLLFVPAVWAATRQGLVGVAFMAFVLQIAVVVIVEWLIDVDVSVFEFQLLGAVLGLVGFFIGVVVDEQRKAAENLKQTLRIAAAGDMATALAHELNQPITALSAYGKACEHLLARGENGDVLRQTIKRMVAESTRAADVVRRLRNFFHTGAVRLERVELGVLMTAATRSSAALAQERDVEFTIAPLPSVAVLADRVQMEVVLHNLLSNAIDSVMAQPGDRRRVNLSADLQANHKLRVTIEDSGPGVTTRVAARLFEPFFSSKSSGLGLGLVISRAIVEAHGGNLWAEVGDHGIFRLELPLAENAET